VSAARKMALSRSQACFTMQSEESLGQFITRAQHLRAELASAQMLKEEEFVLTLLAALNDSEFKPHGLMPCQQGHGCPPLQTSRKTCMGPCRCCVQRPSCTLRHQLQRRHRRMMGKPSQVACDYSHKSGHSILQCFKLKNDRMRTTQM